jgi:hypothetical protein
MKASRMIVAVLILGGCLQGRQGQGWYMMVPPLTKDGFAQTSVSLSQWQNVGSFASHQSCKTVLQQNQFAAGANFGPITQAQSWDERNAVQIMSGQCVPSDNPRLAPH